MAPLRNSNVPEERRHHVRHGLSSSILYVELVPGNGGIIVSLGTGGLSLHAATKLNANEELTLRFQLDPTEKPIEATGRVVWLGSTRKEAGISFKDLPADAERQIANWIAAQEQASVTQHEIDSQPQSPSMASAAPPLSVQGLVPAGPAPDKLANAPSSFGMGIAHRRILKSIQPDDLSSGPSGLPQTASASQALAFPIPEEKFERPSDRLLRSPVKRRQVFLEPEKLAPAPAPQEIGPKNSSLPTLKPSSTQVIEVSHPAPRSKHSVASKFSGRRKFAMAIAACAAGMLALIVTVARVSKPARSDSGGESVEPMSSAATTPGSAPETAPEALTGQSADTIPFTDAPEVADYDLLPVRPTNLPASVPRDGDWGAHVESMLGLDIPMKVNPAVLGLPVWTIQHSGYYYCAENLNSEAPQSGALMMQGEALQSGYQPKLGSYCH